MQCKKCKSFLPPGFVEGDLCVFCVRGNEFIVYDEGKKRATKSELVEEYRVFLRMVKERNEILKNAVKGDLSDIPEKLIVD